MKSVFNFVWFGLVCMLVFTACEQKHEVLEGASAGSTDLEVQVADLFTQKCASCHSPSSGVNSYVEDILDFDELEELEYIIPGDPEASYLYLLISDADAPHKDVVLESEEVNLISNWITALGDDSGAETSAYTFTQVNSQIIQPLCISCHSSSRADGGVNLDEYSEVIKHINTTSAASSLIYSEVQTESMPRGGLRKLSETEKQKILLWIEEGAPNN